MLAENFFTAARRQAGADAITTAGIFGKPKLARLFSTRRAVAAPAFDADYLWTPCEEPGDDTPYCATVPINPATHVRGVGRDRDGRGAAHACARAWPPTARVKRPNLTFVNLPQIDSAGHATGTGAAYDAAIGLADDELRRFVDQQRSLGLWERTVMLVVSDHSMDTTGDKASLDLRFRAAGIASDDYLIVQNGSVDMVYLTDRGRADRDALLARMRAAALPVADEALYRVPNAADGGAAHTLDAVHPGWRIAGERSGDLFVTRGAGAAWSDPANPLTGNHGGPLTSDNTFAVISGGELGAPAVARRGRSGRGSTTRCANPGQAQNVDVAPTVLALLGRRRARRQRGAGARRGVRAGGAARRLPAGRGWVRRSGRVRGGRRRARSCAVRAARRGLRIGFRRRGSRAGVGRPSCGRLSGRRSSRGGSRPAARAGFVWRARGAGRGRVRGAAAGARRRGRAGDAAGRACRAVRGGSRAGGRSSARRDAACCARAAVAAGVRHAARGRVSFSLRRAARARSTCRGAAASCGASAARTRAAAGARCAGCGSRGATVRCVCANSGFGCVCVLTGGPRRTRSAARRPLSGGRRRSRPRSEQTS